MKLPPPTGSASIRISTVLVLGLSASVFALAGCEAGSDASAAPAFMVRDSAGITIAESTDSAWTEATRWRIADEPDLVIGSVDGSVPGTDFGSAPVPVALDRGGVAVMNAQTDDIRVFDAGGAWVRTLGGQGDGPAEFRRLVRIAAVRGDSVAAWDGSAREILTFPLDGGEPRYQATPDRLHAGRFGWDLTAWLPDGRYVLQSRDNPLNRAPGRRLETERLVIHSPDGDSLDAFGPYPAYWTVANELEQVFRPLLERESITHARAETLWWGAPGEGFGIERRDVETGARLRMSRPSNRVAAPDGVREAGLRQELEYAESPEVRAAMQEFWADMPMGDTLPSFLDFRPDAEGGVWVNHLAHPDRVRADDRWNLGAYASPDWTVFDPNGRWLGTVVMPGDFVLHEVGPDWILGTRTDELGVAWIERYPIIKRR